MPLELSTIIRTIILGCQQTDLHFMRRRLVAFSPFIRLSRSPIRASPVDVDARAAAAAVRQIFFISHGSAEGSYLMRGMYAKACSAAVRMVGRYCCDTMEWFRIRYLCCWVFPDEDEEFGYAMQPKYVRWIFIALVCPFML